MKKIIFYILPVSLLLPVLSSCSKTLESTEVFLTDFVNPFIGTAGKGKTYPGVSAPFGMVQLSPDNGRSGWDWISGYYYPDTVLAGFSHLHLAGTGAGDLYDISFFAYTGEPKLADPGELGPGPTPYSRFSHEKEFATPGYYQVDLLDYPIRVELTASPRSGLQKYIFTEAANATITLNLDYTRNWDRVTDSRLEIEKDTILKGYRFSSGWAPDQRVYFYSVLSRPMDSVFQKEKEGIEVSAKIYFRVEQGDSILIKTGISSVSIEQARRNLEAEQQGFNFAGLREKTRSSWESELQKIRIKADPDNTIQFYTAMYHSMLGPTLFSDIDGSYKGANGKIQQTKGFDRYSSFSLWDTYRALHPLATILHPVRTVDFIQSMLAHYYETGLLPVWDLLGNETNMMIGYHAVPVIADAILKGLKGFDIPKAYEAMKHSAMQDQNGLKEYKMLGYVPYEVRNWNVSLTLEYAFDDWCIAQVAEKLGYSEDQEYFSGRAKNYQKHFDAQSRFMRARDSLGKFRPDFNPNAYQPEDYCEANAWQYNWAVPQDPAGLIQLMGGAESCNQMLDSLFTSRQETNATTVWISGYLGQYVHGNEPSHHVPYFFQFTGQPEKTQYWVRKIMDQLYTTQPEGLCGNEDFGQMSAWYIFSALGFYPFNPADGKYLLGSPEIQEAEIRLPGNKLFQITVRNPGANNLYVKAVFLNGQKLNRSYITHSEIMAGGELVFEME